MVRVDNPQKEVYKFICDKLGMKISETLTIAIVNNKEELLAGLTYFLDSKNICYLTVVSNSPYWALPQTLSEICRIGFNDFKAKIIKCEVSNKNVKINKLLKGLGMVKEGLLRYGRQDGTHEIIYSITEKEFIKKRWYRK